MFFSYLFFILLLFFFQYTIIVNINIFVSYLINLKFPTGGMNILKYFSILFYSISQRER